MALTAQVSPCLIDMRRAARACVSLDATMQEMARVLKPGKPASISAIVIATADPRGLERVERELDE